MRSHDDVFYDVYDEAETLTYRTPEDAALAWLDCLDAGREERPASVRVHAWRRQKVKRSAVEFCVRVLLGDLLERLEEEHGDPDDVEPIDLSSDAGVLAAKDALIDAILAAYVPWSCERAPDLDVTVKVAR